MTQRSVLFQGLQLASHFAKAAFQNPVKLARNIGAGIADGPLWAPDKLPATLMGAGGLAVLGIGLAKMDFLMIGLGMTFTSVAGGAFDERGAPLRAADHAQDLAEESKGDIKSPKAADTTAEDDEPTIAEKAEIVAVDGLENTGRSKPSFKPDLSRFKTGPGPADNIGGGPA